MLVPVFFFVLVTLHTINAFQNVFSRRLLNKFYDLTSYNLLQAVPLELTGQLDPSKSWSVRFVFNGVEKIVNVCEDTCLLEASEKVFDDAPSSCRNGVCTTCCGKVLEGRPNVKLAVHGLGVPQIEAGFVCMCQAYATGPGIVLQMGAYDEVYETQYGQFERSYQGKTKVVEEKKKNLFGF